MSKNNNKKVCSRCKELKPYSEFFKDKHNKKYGLSGYCKACKVAYQKGLRNKNKPIQESSKPLKDNGNKNSELINSQQHGPLRKRS